MLHLCMGVGVGVESVTGFMQPCQTGRDGPIRVKCSPSYMRRPQQTFERSMKSVPQSWSPPPEGQSCNLSAPSAFKSCNSGDAAYYNSAIKMPINCVRETLRLFQTGGWWFKAPLPGWAADHCSCLAERLQACLSLLSGHLTKKPPWIQSDLQTTLIFVFCYLHIHHRHFYTSLPQAAPLLKLTFICASLGNHTSSHDSDASGSLGQQFLTVQSGGEDARAHLQPLPAVVDSASRGTNQPSVCCFFRFLQNLTDFPQFSLQKQKYSSWWVSQLLSHPKLTNTFSRKIKNKETHVDVGANV